MTTLPIIQDGPSKVAELPDGGRIFLETVYDRAQANGVTVLVVASMISLFAVVGLLVALGLSAFNTRFSQNKALFVRTHVAAYFVSLLFCELLEAIGSIMSIRWVQEMAVNHGAYCTVQAIIKQVADLGTALWALILAIHTFCILFLEFRAQGYVRWLTLIAGWAFIGLLAMVGPATVKRHVYGPFHGISGYWCWISPVYESERITQDYMWMWISAVLSLTLYLLVWLRLRGNVVVSGWTFKFVRSSGRQSRAWGEKKFEERQILVIARQMLLYPMAYTIIILPIAAARFSQFAGKDVPFGVTIFCDTIYLLSGLVNVVLFATTRRVLPTRSVFNLVISKPVTQQDEPLDDLYNPDDYYDKDDFTGKDANGQLPTLEKSWEYPAYGSSSFNDVERGVGSNIRQADLDGAHEIDLRQVIAQAPKTPLFRRDSGYSVTEEHHDHMSGVEEGYYHQAAHVADDRHVPQLTLKSPATAGLRRDDSVSTRYSGHSAPLELSHGAAEMSRSNTVKSNADSVLDNYYARQSMFNVSPSASSPPPLPTAPLNIASKKNRPAKFDQMDEVSLE